MFNHKYILFSILICGLSLSVAAQQKIGTPFFDQANAFFLQHVTNGKLSYANLKDNAELKTLIQQVETATLAGADDATLQAFYINAYNLHVINAAAKKYPIQSVQAVGGFFDRQKITVAGKSTTLNKLEKEQLLSAYGDARFHFVLVCGALGCPPITNFAYRPEKLEEQLEQQTRLALNNPQFIQVNPKEQKVAISKIFQWYPGDFGGNTKKAITFINRYRKMPIPATYKVSFYEYDWSLNDRAAGNSSSDVISPIGANASRYVVSSTIPKGSIELKLFNNLYTQRTTRDGELKDRSTFFTSSLSALYGLNDRLNVGFELRYRQVRNDNLPSSALEVLVPRDNGTNRFGLTGIGPKIRWAPVRAWGNFSIQSALFFTPGSNLRGSSDQPFIDWDGAIWFTQIFNDFTIGNQFSLFTELDLFFEDLGTDDDLNNQFTTPITLIASYFPNPKTTLYVLGNYAPIWTPDNSYYAQAGVGAKYQFTPNVELELLYTGFTNEFLSDNDGKAATYNLGLRFNL